MKTRTRELARPGIFGSVDNPQIVTEKDLQEIAETFPDVQKAPVTFGHWPDPTRPRLGNVIAVQWDPKAKVLTGTIEEQDELAKAVDEGYYPDVSIGAKRRAVDGKMYLHHLAYLGEEPPAIKDLVASINKELMPDIAASDFDGAISFPSPNAVLVEQRTAQKAPESTSGKPDVGEADAPAATINLADASKSADAARRLEAQLRAIKKDALLKAAAGRIPKAKEPLLITLSDSLGVSASLELSDEAGNKRTVSPIDLLEELIQSLPLPVQEGRLALSESDTKPIDLRGLLKHV
ncbi:hypothetical protein [Gracilinema caldarium]|uniref:hypothetical protein n=1 Tax=Gracilinema caldarium TaxID=215591 RepID=UPI0026F2C4DA|nr:hypothetical protein [Gracilinema caldarium]